MPPISFQSIWTEDSRNMNLETGVYVHMGQQPETHPLNHWLNISRVAQ